MSNPFGVPPPPQPLVFEPRRPTLVAEPPPPRIVVSEPDRGRRLLALTAAFFAVTLLALASLGSWLQYNSVRAADGAKVASATFPAVAQEIAPQVQAAVRPLVQARPATGSGDAPRLKASDRSIDPAVAVAVQRSIDSQRTRDAWTDGVSKALVAEPAIEESEGDSDPVASLPLTPIAVAALADLRAQGYTVSATPPSLAQFTAVLANGNGGLLALAGLADVWWLLGLGAVALGLLSVYLAARRLRMAVVLAVDTAVMFTLLLVTVFISRAVADDTASTPAEADVMRLAYEVLTRSLVVQTVAVIVIAVCVAVVLGLLALRRPTPQPRPEAAEAAA